MGLGPIGRRVIGGQRVVRGVHPCDIGWIASAFSTAVQSLGPLGFAGVSYANAKRGPATLVGDVEAPNLLFTLDYRYDYHMGHPPKSITLVVAGAVRAFDLDPIGRQY